MLGIALALGEVGDRSAPFHLLPRTRALLLSRTADQGRPTCLALVGKLYGEAELLSVAEAWQNATRWHLARPELTR